MVGWMLKSAGGAAVDGLGGFRNDRTKIRCSSILFRGSLSFSQQSGQLYTSHRQPLQSAWVKDRFTFSVYLTLPVESDPEANTSLESCFGLDLHHRIARGLRPETGFALLEQR